MTTPEELMRADLFARFGQMPVGEAIARLYDVSKPVGQAMAHLHERLNTRFTFMNTKVRINHHYNADQSRELLDLIEEVKSTQAALKRTGITLTLRDDYQANLDYAASFLTRSGRSTIPDDFTGINVVEYEPVFTSSETEVELTDRCQRVQPKMVGEGAFAHVYSYTDPECDKKFVIKRAKSNLDPKELVRFRQEFDILHGLNFPYILEVYRYNDYRMEFCDGALEVFVSANNAHLKFGPRRRIALQFLYALNYLHGRRILHRDISLRNILVKAHDGGAATVKLSDFGFAKDAESQLTQTDSEKRGSIIAPALASFKSYAVINEIYPIGHILSFIFSGRKTSTPRAAPSAPSSTNAWLTTWRRATRTSSASSATSRRSLPTRREAPPSRRRRMVGRSNLRTFRDSETLEIPSLGRRAGGVLVRDIGNVSFGT